MITFRIEKEKKDRMGIISSVLCVIPRNGYSGDGNRNRNWPYTY